jgi:hypothetical protein
MDDYESVDELPDTEPHSVEMEMEGAYQRSAPQGQAINDLDVPTFLRKRVQQNENLREN